MLRIKKLLDNVTRSSLGLQVNLSNILSDDTKSEQNQTSDRPDRYGKESPADNSRANRVPDQGINQDSDTDKKNNDGFVESDVIPSTAKEIIFFSGYLLSPANRSALS